MLVMRRLAPRLRLRYSSQVPCSSSALLVHVVCLQTETEVLLKSLIAGTLCPLHLHFLVAGDPELSSLHSMMVEAGARELIARPSPVVAGKQTDWKQSDNENQGYEESVPSATEAPLLFSLHMLPTEWVEERLKAMFLYPPIHHAGLPGLSKFFLADIMWQVNRGIFLDVDMLAGSDVGLLQEHFKEFDADPQLLYFMSNNNPEGSSRKRFRKPYCSCQMVMDLQRIRQRNLTKVNDDVWVFLSHAGCVSENEV